MLIDYCDDRPMREHIISIIGHWNDRLLSTTIINICNNRLLIQ